jgi:MFS family permease
MKKTIFALVAAATIAASTLSPTPADARWRGGGIGLGILGGVVAGAIIGSAIANHDGYYRYDGYRDAPYGCYWARRAWRDEDGRVHYGRPRQFCD